MPVALTVHVLVPCSEIGVAPAAYNFYCVPPFVLVPQVLLKVPLCAQDAQLFLYSSSG
jgi:hypothetical protein